MLYITNEIKVMIKEKQLEVLKKWLSDNRNKKSQYYPTFKKLAEDLPEDIEKFQGLAMFDKRFADVKNGPTIVRLNHTDEFLEQWIIKYQASEMMNPGAVPLRKEYINLYQEVLEHFTKDLDK